jgi:multiple sugar transport system permease protein
LEVIAYVSAFESLRRFRHVILWLSTNAITALAILVFLGHYNDLLWPFVTMNSLEKRTLPVGLQILNSAYADSFRPIVLAGSVFATVPIVIFYIIFHRRIIKDVTMTGMGGR